MLEFNIDGEEIDPSKQNKEQWKHHQKQSIQSQGMTESRQEDGKCQVLGSELQVLTGQ